MKRQVQRIYRRIPTLNCKGLCTDSCGPILYSRAEERCMPKPLPTVDNSLTCSWLKDGRCSHYEHRPAICRLYGAVKAMRCEHGCEPEGRSGSAEWLSDEEAHQILSELDAMRGPSRKAQRNLLKK